jgi:hypothetical protein
LSTDQTAFSQLLVVEEPQFGEIFGNIILGRASVTGHSCSAISSYTFSNVIDVKSKNFEVSAASSFPKPSQMKVVACLFTAKMDI